MKVLIVLLGLSFVSFATSFKFLHGIRDTFDDFKNEFGKVYKNEMEARIAEAAFVANLALITLANAIPGRKFKLGLNEYADRTFDFFREHMLGLILPSDSSERGNRVEFQNSGVQGRSETENYSQVTTPASVDYRNRSMPVQNQMNCGSCYAFTAIGVLGEILKI